MEYDLKVNAEEEWGKEGVAKRSWRGGEVKREVKIESVEVQEDDGFCQNLF